MNTTLPNSPSRPFAVVTGASSGIGLELARELCERGHDVLIAAEDPGIYEAQARLELTGSRVEVLQVDLGNWAGVELLYGRVRELGRPVDVLALNAGIGVGGEFARETSLAQELKLIQVNVASTVHLAKLVARDMVAAKHGKILFTSSVAALMPAPLEAVYGASKAFVQSFAESLRSELKDHGVSVTALLPGPTETNFFHRAGMDHTRVGESKKDSPAQVAKQGINALLAGRESVIAGSAKNKLFLPLGRLLPERMKAAMHRRLSEPASH